MLELLQGFGQPAGADRGPSRGLCQRSGPDSRSRWPGFAAHLDKCLHLPSAFSQLLVVVLLSEMLQISALRAIYSLFSVHLPRSESLHFKVLSLGTAPNASDNSLSCKHVNLGIAARETQSLLPLSGFPECQLETQHIPPELCRKGTKHGLTYETKMHFLYINNDTPSAGAADVCVSPGHRPS